VRARGGAITSLVRDAEADVRVEFPGRWRWWTVFLVPDRLAWTIETSGEPDHYLFDGSVVRAFIGANPIGLDVDPRAPLRLHARLVAATMLDALHLPGVRVRELAPSELSAGCAAGLEAAWLDGADPVRLGLDERGLVVRAEGAWRFPPGSDREVVASFADFRRTGRWLLPYRTTYVVGDTEVAVEQARTLCVDHPSVGAETFRVPTAPPECPPPLVSR
jgi:hypothetical protein